ncbi:MAG: hypothetical protein GX780_00915, partial [Campylobacteraceae bacterium]|nr:hypothetical protein [Campylobacteraceae bacterium]
LYTIYWHGIGVKKDPKKAGEYHRLAQANGFDVRSALPVKSVSSETETKAMIISVQTGLKSLGFYKGTVDGVSGPMTSKAIITFQQFHGYRVDDKITQDLVDKINSKL